jgi:hypothetical protein
MCCRVPTAVVTQSLSVHALTLVLHTAMALRTPSCAQWDAAVPQPWTRATKKYQSRPTASVTAAMGRRRRADRLNGHEPRGCNNRHPRIRLSASLGIGNKVPARADSSSQTCAT